MTLWLQYAGNGKTHYITSQLKQCPQSLHITISETFTVLNVIKKLNSIPIDEKGCGIFFNFTLLPPGVSVFKHPLYFVNDSAICGFTCYVSISIMPGIC